ncbi:hypothetical protein A9Q99_10220 [Gammaproteobacteria bacterium 45_16_T64]|nr:hypothetical protein A9Q99_10220 [Gammaproteobacteria bacterium 45_16_T64]
MNYEEAIQLLSYHSGYSEDVENPKWAKGFLGQLRPFSGELYEDNFKEVMDIIETIAVEIRGKTIDQEIIAMLYDISTVPRLWAFDPEGMLRRNNLISEDQLTILNDWLIRICEAISYLLNGEGFTVEQILTGYGEQLPKYFSGKLT